MYLENHITASILLRSLKQSKYSHYKVYMLCDDATDYLKNNIFPKAKNTQIYNAL
jgi:hypothetical protein